MTRPRLQRILLVEDDPDIAVLASIALEEIGGFTLLHAASGNAALAMAERDSPDLVILDYRLPDMTGADVLARLRDGPATRALPAVFFTANLMPRQVDVLLASGALGVIAKPFDPLTLCERVTRLWNEPDSSQPR